GVYLLPALTREKLMEKAVGKRRGHEFRTPKVDPY
ncbi:MAG: hypothetical protein RJB13_1292, partial [Pseudomonadota bacterium]